MSGGPHVRTLGIALDGTTATAVWRTSATDAWHSMAVPCDATPAAVVHAFAEIARAAPVLERVRVALLRPLASARTLDFPRMSRAALERVLERDWSRYAIGLWPTPHTVAARMAGTGQWRAVFAPTETLEAIVHAAQEHGWTDVATQGSDDAVAGAARDHPAGPTGSTECVIVCDAVGPTDGVIIVDGSPQLGRRFLHTGTDSAVIAFVQAAHADRAAVSAPAVRVFGTPSRAAALAKALGQSGYRARAERTEGDVADSSAAIIAVAGALGLPALALRSPSTRSANTHRMRRVTAWFVLSMAAALLVAFAVERTAVSATMAQVQRQRADISGPVRNAMSARRQLNDAHTAASALAGTERASSRVTSVISAVAMALPAGTALTSLAVSGDSVTIEGESKRSAAVYDALRAVPQLEQVRLAASLRQDRLGAEAPVERFSFSARIRADAPGQPGASR